MLQLVQHFFGQEVHEGERHRRDDRRFDGDFDDGADRCDCDDAVADGDDSDDDEENDGRPLCFQEKDAFPSLVHLYRKNCAIPSLMNVSPLLPMVECHQS